MSGILPAVVVSAMISFSSAGQEICLSSQSTTAAAGHGDSVMVLPVMSIDCETADLGVIEKDGSRRHVFKITNSGKAPLVIQSIYSGCRCTSIEYSTDPVMPGDTTTVAVTFDSRGRSPGYFTKLVRIRSNAGSQPRRLYIKGRVAER
ncbi:MAG: DUF1573 domain-containing protein [Paramuribaculum sp.]|nr:DUF1573 domain-containing protein [Paramuribaculum sp.]